MRFPRSSGVLLHPSSLPGEYGIGDLGAGAHDFVDFLAETGQTWWQVLPLGPTGGTHSPYQSFSSFAGNPLLISIPDLVKEGWLDAKHVQQLPRFPEQRVNFSAVARLKQGLLRRAFKGFSSGDAGYREFLAANAHWIEDYCLFVALKEETGGKAWFQWEHDLAARNPEALARCRERLAANIEFHRFVQYAFERQMQAMRQRCRKHGVKLIGDVPIFVAHDSVDVWVRPELFHLDRKGRLTAQAGVPPDLFSTTGQLWGNPVYCWEAHEKEGFAWWIARLSALLRWVDLIRIDHFRGFESYWEVPGKARTAARGRWVPSPGKAFFTALKRHYPDLPLIAEDLGVITPPVEALRDEFDLPGMRVLQFGFSSSSGEEKYLPHRFIAHCIAYTGTHDNDTALGWLRATGAATTQSKEEIRAERAYALRYVGTRGEEFHWDMIRLALGSVADVAIVPMQDLLGLGSEARMNVPGTAAGNWGWRYSAPQLSGEVKRRLSDLTAVYSRWNGAIPTALDPHHVPGRAPTPGSEPSKPPRAPGRGPAKTSGSRKRKE